MKIWSRGDKLALFALIVAVIGAIAAIVVIPQVQTAITDVSTVASQSLLPPSLPQEAQDELDRHFSQTLNYLKPYTIENFEQGIYPDQNVQEMWCTYLTGVNFVGVYSNWHYWIILRRGLAWEISKSSQEGFRRFNCTIG